MEQIDEIAAGTSVVGIIIMYTGQQAREALQKALSASM